MLFEDLCSVRLREWRTALDTRYRLVFLQGMALAEKYPPPLVRQMSDVDLFLPDGGAEELRLVLESAGARRYRDYGNVWVVSGLMIDIHQDPWGADRIRARRFCAPGDPLTFSESNRYPGFYVLSPRQLFSQTVLHGLKHGFQRLVWDLDLLALHRAGYDRISGSQTAAALDNIASDRLSRVWGIKDAPQSGAMPGMRLRCAARIIRQWPGEGTGEIALALCCGKWRQTVACIAESFLPSKRVMAEMYGPGAYWLMVIKRLWALLRMSKRILKRA